MTELCFAEFAKCLQGYPLAAKLSAYRINNHGYDYYLQQLNKIQSLKIGLAKEFIDYARSHSVNFDDLMQG